MGTETTIGQEIAKLSKLRTKRMRLEKQHADAKAEETTQKELVLEHLRANNLDKQGGAGLMCAVKEQEFVSVEDWAAIDRFVVRNKCPEIFQRRIGLEAYRELLEKRKGTPIPGSHIGSKTSLSVTAMKKPTLKKVAG